MADVNISKYRASVVREGSKPASPGFVVSEGQDPVNPPGTNNFVPYSGATSNVELGEFGLETGFINLDTTPTGTPTTQGTIFWDADDETVDIILNGYTMKIGEDLFYPVKNQTGSTIAKGVAVRFAGTLGASGRLLIEPFIANGTVPSSRFMGVTAEEILNGDDGKVLYFGRVRGINTDAFNEGDILYASTTVAGGYQTAIPLPPNNIVQVAAVISKHVNNGTIFVRPTLGSNINTDEGVKITSVADKNLLQYQSGTALWENKTLAQVLGGTSSQFVKGDGSLDSNTYLTTSAAASTYVPYTGATSNVNLGIYSLSSSNVIANGGFNSGALFLKQSNNAQTINLDYTTITPIGTTQLNFGFSQSSGVWKSFVLNAINLTNNINRTYTLPDASGTIALVGGAGVGTVTSVGLSSATSGVTIGSSPVTTSGTITLAIATASASQNGLLSSTDWTTFNNKQNALTNPVTGTGTTNYLPKFTGASTIGNSIVQDAGTRIDVAGVLRLTPSSTTDIQAYTGSAYSNLFYDAASHNWQTSGGTAKMTLTSGGNLLVGTTSDNGARLQVSGGITALNSLVVTSSSNAALIASTNSTTGFSYLDFINSGASGRNYQIGVAGNGASSGYANNLYFDLVGVANIMTLTSGRNVLIGTQTDNGARLQVSGTSTFGGRLLVSHSTSGNYGAVIYNTSATGEGLVVRGGSTSSHSAFVVQPYDGSVSLFNVLSTGAATFTTTENQGGLLVTSATDNTTIRVASTATGGQEWRMQSTGGGSGLGQGKLFFKVGGTETPSHIPLTLTTDNSINGGRVGIGTTSPTYALDAYSTGSSTARLRVQGTTNFALTQAQNSSGILYMGIDSSTADGFGLGNYSRIIWSSAAYPLIFAVNDAERMRITSGGEVLIGNTDNGAYNLQCNGTGVWGAGAYVNGSDRNIKDNIATIEKGLEYIQKMNPVKFRYKPNYTRDHSMQTGFIAQELQEVFASEDYLSGLVQQGVHLSVAYQNLLPVLVKAIQELKQEIDTLKN